MYRPKSVLSLISPAHKVLRSLNCQNTPDTRWMHFLDPRPMETSGCTLHGTRCQWVIFNPFLIYHTPKFWWKLFRSMLCDSLISANLVSYLYVYTYFNQKKMQVHVNVFFFLMDVFYNIKQNMLLTYPAVTVELFSRLICRVLQLTLIFNGWAPRMVLRQSKTRSTRAAHADQMVAPTTI